MAVHVVFVALFLELLRLCLFIFHSIFAGSLSPRRGALQWENLREGDHLKNPGVDGRIILKWIFERFGGGSMEWNHLADDRDRWQAVVNTVMNFRVP
jgi:hypothetical protein